MRGLQNFIAAGIILLLLGGCGGSPQVASPTSLNVAGTTTGAITGTIRDAYVEQVSLNAMSKTCRENGWFEDCSVLRRNDAFYDRLAQRYLDEATNPCLEGDDFGLGDDVVVRSGNNEILAVGRLEPGVGDSAMFDVIGTAVVVGFVCEMPFTAELTNVVAEFYSVSVDGVEAGSFTHAEMESLGWHIDLTDE